MDEKFEVSCNAIRSNSIPSAKSRRRVVSSQKQRRTTRSSKAAGFVLKVVVDEKGKKKATRYYGSDGNGGLSAPRNSMSGLKPFARKATPNRLGKQLCRQIREEKAKKGTYTWALKKT